MDGYKDRSEGGFYFEPKMTKQSHIFEPDKSEVIIPEKSCSSRGDVIGRKSGVIGRKSGVIYVKF